MCVCMLHVYMHICVYVYVRACVCVYMVRECIHGVCVCVHGMHVCPHLYVSVYPYVSIQLCQINDQSSALK